MTRALTKRRGWNTEAAPIAGVLMVAPLTILLAALFLWPLVQLVWTALGDGEFTWTHFQRFFERRASINALVNTLGISAVVTLLALSSGEFLHGNSA